MQLNIQTFTSLVSGMNARVQASVTSVQAFVDVSVGSIVNALNEASAASGLWLQYIALQVLTATRLSTSSGDDVTSFIADYSLTRLAAVSATGQVTLNRLTTLASVSVSVGNQVRTGDGTGSYYISGDSTLPYWDSTVGTGGGYIIPVGVAQVTLPIIAVVPGAAGNVASGAISLLGGISGISSATNANPITGGLDVESDIAVKKRFPLYIGSLSKATKLAIESAVDGVQQNLSYTVQPNTDASGVFAPGHFLIRVDDGTGAPSAALISKIYAAVDLVRAFCEVPAVLPAIVSYVNISLNVGVNGSGNKSNVVPLVHDAVAAYVKSLGIGDILSATRIAFIAYGVDPTITNVSYVILNGGPSDIVPPVGGLLKPGSIVVN